MGEPINRTNNQEKKKMVIKMERGGGGFGAVILLGGALFTVALAAAFVSRRKGRSNRDSTPGKAAAAEQDESCSNVNKSPSETMTKEIEIEDDTQSLVLDENPKIEINGGPAAAACDGGQASEQIIGSVTPEAIQNDRVLDNSVTEKSGSHLSKLSEIETESNKENTEVIMGDDGSFFVGVHIVDRIKAKEEHYPEVKIKEKEGKGYFGDNGVIDDAKREEEVEKNEVDGEEKLVPIEDVDINKENGATERGKDNIVEQSGKENGQEFDRFGDEIIPEKSEATNKDVESEVDNIEEQSGKEKGQEFDQFDEEIVPEKNEVENKEDVESEVHEENILIKDDEGKGFTNATREDVPFEKCDKDTVPVVEIKEMISPREIEAKTDQEECENLELDENNTLIEKVVENEVEDPIKKIGDGEEKSDEYIEEDYGTETDDEDLSDGTEENSVGTGDSSVEEAVWPAEEILEASVEAQQNVKLIAQEVEGKILEDKTVEVDNKGIENLPIIGGKDNSAKALVEKYVVQVSKLMDYSKNSRMLVGTVSIFSSMWCWWFFGLSYANLCVVLFLTMVLSKSLAIMN